MNVFDLEYLFSKNSYTKRLYHGTYALDRVPELVNHGFIVINTDPHDAPGQHWLLYMLDRNNRYIFVDSFGLQPVEKELWFLPVDEYSGKCIQSIYSVHCGLYVCLFASKLCKGYSLESIVSLFDNCLIHNDLLVIKLVEDEFFK